jgi:hypothetical protein
MIHSAIGSDIVHLAVEALIEGCALQAQLAVTPDICVISNVLVTIRPSRIGSLCETLRWNDECDIYKPHE